VYAKLPSPEALLLAQNAPQTVWRLGSARNHQSSASYPVAELSMWGPCKEKGVGEMQRGREKGKTMKKKVDKG